MGKHAYCILAHNEPVLFKRLIQQLDFPDNDIFVHIDSQADIREFNNVQCRYSNLVFLEKRIHCGWGSISIVQAEFSLFEEARNKNHYSYYHLLSGVDFPLKSQQFIHNFTDRLAGTNFIGRAPLSPDSKALKNRYQYYHFFIRRPSSGIWNHVLSLLDRVFVKIQKFFHISRTSPVPILKGAQWLSITDDFCDYILKRKDELLHRFNYPLCPDEAAIQSYFFSSPFKDTQYKPEATEFEQCMREIDWTRGKPYTWGDEDLKTLLSSEKFFARKFSSKNSTILNDLSNAIHHS